VVIKSFGLKKAPGPDQVTPKMLKELPQKRIVLLTYLSNIWIFFADLGTPTAKCRARETACSWNTSIAEYGKAQILILIFIDPLGQR
jgi:hypothetical protein